MAPDTALALLVIALGAFAAPLLARRVGVPTAVGEILFGIAIGRGGLGLVGESEIVAFLSLLGFIFLMFAAGLEIDFRVLENPAARRRAILGTVALAAVSWGASLAIGRGPLIALLLGAVSIGIAVPVLRETGHLRTPFGQLLLALGVAGEVATLAGLTLYEAFAEHGVSWSMAAGLLRLGLVVGAAAVLLRLLALAAWWEPEKFAPIADPNDPSEIGVRGTLALLFLLVSLAALLGIEPIVGAFLAGALTAFVFREIHLLEAKVAGAGYGFFIPVFFIDVGMRFDPRGLFAADVVQPALVLVAAIAAVRLVVVPFLLAEGGPRRALAGALLLGAPLTLLVAIAEVAHRWGRVTYADESALVLAAILTGVVFPPIFRRLAAGESAEGTQ